MYNWKLNNHYISTHSLEIVLHCAKLLLYLAIITYLDIITLIFWTNISQINSRKVDSAKCPSVSLTSDPAGCLTPATGAPTSACWLRAVPNTWQRYCGLWCTSIIMRTCLTMTSPCCSWRSPGLLPSARWSSLCACQPPPTLSLTATAAGSLGGDTALRRVSNCYVQ